MSAINLCHIITRHSFDSVSAYNFKTNKALMLRKQIKGYSLVGIFISAIHYSFSLLLNWMGISILVANMLAFAFCYPLSLYLNGSFVFEKKYNLPYAAFLFLWVEVLLIVTHYFAPIEKEFSLKLIFVQIVIQFLISVFILIFMKVRVFSN